ncbi:Os02g0332800, partial [Oryza sativa Japonica Group]
ARYPPPFAPSNHRHLCSSPGPTPTAATASAPPFGAARRLHLLAPSRPPPRTARSAPRECHPRARPSRTHECHLRARAPPPTPLPKLSPSPSSPARGRRRAVWSAASSRGHLHARRLCDHPAASTSTSASSGRRRPDLLLAAPTIFPVQPAPPRRPPPSPHRPFPIRRHLRPRHRDRSTARPRRQAPSAAVWSAASSRGRLHARRLCDHPAASTSTSASSGRRRPDLLLAAPTIFPVQPAPPRRPPSSPHRPFPIRRHLRPRHRDRSPARPRRQAPSAAVSPPAAPLVPRPSSFPDAAGPSPGCRRTGRHPVTAPSPTLAPASLSPPAPLPFSFLLPPPPPSTRPPSPALLFSRARVRKPRQRRNRERDARRRKRETDQVKRERK